MAKAQGFEPQLAVLETAVLPLDYALKFDNKKAPTVSDQGCKILLCVCYALKPQYITYNTLLVCTVKRFYHFFRCIIKITPLEIGAYQGEIRLRR